MNPPRGQAGAELLELVEVLDELIELVVLEEVGEVSLELESELVVIGSSELLSLVDVSWSLAGASSVIVTSGTPSGTSGGSGTAGGIGAPTGITTGGIGTKGKTVLQIGPPQLQLKVVLTGTPSQTCPVVQLNVCITVVTGTVIPFEIPQVYSTAVGVGEQTGLAQVVEVKTDSVVTAVAVALTRRLASPITYKSPPANWFVTV